TSDPLADLAPSQKRKTSIIFSLDDAPGRLASCLIEFGQRGVNLSKVESKPRLGHGSDHVFYLDFEGDALHPRVAEALERVRLKSVQFSLLGSYDAHEGAPVAAGHHGDVSARHPESLEGRGAAATWHPHPI